MKNLENCIREQVDVNNSTVESILSRFERITLKRGDYLLKSGSVCRNMAFIDSGYMRMFNMADGKDITLWIGSQGKFITSLASFTFLTPNFWNIQAISDCQLLVIDRESHFELCQQEPKWLEFDNKLLANAYALLEKSMFAQLHTTAKQRLDNLLEEEPELFLNVPLQYIASMIGITPESLSRLRKHR